MRSLRDVWISYRERVVPPNAGPRQALETQLAFYAGAAAMWDLVVHQLGPGVEPEQADVDLMGSLERELLDFVKAQEVRRGGVQ